MQEHVFNVKENTTRVKQEQNQTKVENNNNNNKTSMTLYPYYHSRLKIIADSERRTMVSYIYECLDVLFEKHKDKLEERGLSPR